MDIKKKIYYDNKILLASLIGLALILYAIGVAVFLNKGDDKTVGAFEAVSSVTGIILSICTIFYVVKAFEQQKRQNDIQSEQINIQKDEIENNRQDAEFIRVIDVVFRQMELSLPNMKNNWYVNLERELLDDFKGDGDKANYIDDYKNEILNYLMNTSKHIENFIFIIKSSGLDFNRKDYIKNLVINNLNSDFKYLFERFEVLSFRYPKDTIGMLELIEEILAIYKPIQES